MINVAIGIYIKDNKCLVAKRSPVQSHAGYYELPGGKIEADETAINALIREWQEELAVNVTAEKLFEHSHDYENYRVKLHIFNITSCQGIPQAQIGQQLNWCALNALEQLKWMPANISVIEKMKIMF